MSDNIEVDELTGQAAFFSAREVAWHQLGTVTPDAVTAEEALRVSYLGGWDVRLVPDVAFVEDTIIEVPGRARTVRTNPFNGKPEVMGNVSDGYTVVQNEEAFAVLDAIGQEGGAKFETAGSLTDGTVFVTMRMPEALLVGNMDPVETYILVTTTHNGNGSTQALIVPNRVVCRNTLDLAVRGAHRKVAIRHTTNAIQRMQVAAEVLAGVDGYVSQIKQISERLLNKQMGLSEVDAFLEKLFPLATSAAKATVTTTTNKRNDVRALVMKSPTIDDEIRFTGWGVLNAVAEQVDWFSAVRGADDESARRAIRSNFESAGSDFKTKALNLILAA